MWQAAAFFGCLYFWLRGDWFGRVIAFLFFATLFVICGNAGIIGRDASPMGFAIYSLCCCVIAWLVAGLPTYARRPGFWRRLVRLRLPVLYDGVTLRR